MAAVSVLAEPPEDILDVDNGVIDELANRDGETSQCHRID